MPRAKIDSTPEEDSESEQYSRKAGPSYARGHLGADAEETEESDGYGDEMDVDDDEGEGEGEGEGEDEGDNDDLGEEADEQVDVEGEDRDESVEPEELPSTPSRARKGRGLKITLKLPHQPPRRRARIVESTDPSEPPSRDVESEDEDGTGNYDDEEDEVMPAPSGRTLTARQAVLASVVDPSHVSLDDTMPSRKKKQLNEAELALRREETARKRKHMSEKKLEDEKAETINRLLKKQSRPRNKRNALATADDRTPASQTNAAGTPDGDDDGGEAFSAPIEIPTMYRWISTSRRTASLAEGEAQSLPSNPEMTLSFSVPLGVLSNVGRDDVAGSTDASMSIDAPSRKMTPYCVAPGCDRVSKYRLRSNFLQGVCGIEHLKLLDQSPKIQ